MWHPQQRIHTHTHTHTHIWKNSSSIHTHSKRCEVVTFSIFLLSVLGLVNSSLRKVRVQLIQSKTKLSISVISCWCKNVNSLYIKLVFWGVMVEFEVTSNRYMLHLCLMHLRGFYNVDLFTNYLKKQECTGLAEKISAKPLRSSSEN